MWVYFMCYGGVSCGALGEKSEEKIILMLGKKQGETM